MDIVGILGFFVGFGMLLLGFIMEKGSIMALIALSPAVIVLGGTLGALMISYTKKEIASIPRLFKEAVTLNPSSAQNYIEVFVQLSEIARREGLLQLENTVREGGIAYNVNPMLEKGINLIVDGSQQEFIKDLMETDIYVTDQEKKTEAGIFETAGGYSPTMGIIGTVMGLVHVLGNLSSPEAMGPAISAAFIATLYGVGFANLIYLPIASKLKLKAKKEKLEKEMIIEGILSIQAGENPTLLRDKLQTFIVGSKKTENIEQQD